MLFAVGTRFNDRITGKIEQFASGAAVVHVDIDAASNISCHCLTFPRYPLFKMQIVIGSSYTTAVAISCIFICPEYTPDFIKLAESYGAKGIRVTDEKEMIPALETAKNNQTQCKYFP